MAESMLALVNYEPRDGAVEVREWPIPRIGEDEVLLAVKAAAVCGTDIHIYHGAFPDDVLRPVVLGHEFAGVVARTGRGVCSFREGDRVVSETAAEICGRCALCRSGHYNLCPERKGFGARRDGAFASFVRVPERCLHRLPEGIPFEEAALVEPACVAYNAVAVQSRIEPGARVVILGAGPIGVQCVQIARLFDPGEIIIVGLERDSERFKVAREVGADRTIASDREDAPRAVRDGGDGLGADLVVDAVGISDALRVALDMVRPLGQITKVGWGPEPCGFSLDPLVLRSVRLQGSFSHTAPMWEKVIALLGEGRIRHRPLISLERPLAGWREVFEAMESGRALKGVLHPDG